MGRERLGRRGRFRARKEQDASMARGGASTRAANKDKRVIASGVQESSVNTHRLPCVLDTLPKPRPPSHPLVEISDPESELKEPRGSNPLPPTSSSCLALEPPCPRRWPPATCGYLNSITITHKFSSSATRATFKIFNSLT